MKNPFRHPRRAQQGVATLFMTLVMLIIAGLVLLYTSRGAVTEQRLSANEIRAKQAFAAANAGIDAAFAYMSSNGINQSADSEPDHILASYTTSSFDYGVDRNADGDVLDASDISTTTNITNSQPSYYKATYCDPTLANPPTCPASHTTNWSGCTNAAGTAPTDPTEVMVVACGWSDDDSAVHRVTQRIGGTPGLSGDVPNPLISRGTANLLVGGASILNYYNDLTVWSGGSTIGQSMTGKTFVRDTVTYPDVNNTLDTDNDGTPDYRDTGNSPACNNPPVGYTCSTQGSTMGHDVIMADTRLTQGSDADFFAMFFGASPDNYRDHTSGWVVDTNDSLAFQDSTNLNSIYNANGLTQHQNIWLEGDVTINGEIGTPEKPVILIVNGDLSLGANAVINGVVYTQGTVDSTGTPTIYGALITAADANTVGNLKVIYDPFEGEGLPTLGKPTKLQGSWKDW